MSVRLKLRNDGSIEAVEADTVAELVGYHQQYASRNGTAPTKKGPRIKYSPGEEGDEPLPEAAEKLVKLLFSASDGMDTGDIAVKFGVEPKGVGGSVTSLTAWGRRHNLSKKQLLRKERRENGHGHFVRRLALSDHFRKMIKEGKVPGMKIDT
jgi:hypothetical protein